MVDDLQPDFKKRYISEAVKGNELDRFKPQKRASRLPFLNP